MAWSCSSSCTQGFVPKDEMRKFSGNSRDYPLWKLEWQSKIEPQYKDTAQVSIVRDYLPLEVVQEMVGVNVTTMRTVWTQMDERFGDPITIADDVRR